MATPQSIHSQSGISTSTNSSLVLPVTLIVWPLTFGIAFILFMTAGYGSQGFGLQKLVDTFPDSFVMELSFLLFLGLPLVIIAGPVSFIAGIYLLIKRLNERNRAKN